jgi:hypothetical protein
MHKNRTAHLTSVHPRTDTRIFLKECTSLASHGYAVSLVVADGKGDEGKTRLLFTMSVPPKVGWIVSATYLDGF